MPTVENSCWWHTCAALALPVTVVGAPGVSRKTMMFAAISAYVTHGVRRTGSRHGPGSPRRQSARADSVRKPRYGELANHTRASVRLHSP